MAVMMGLEPTLFDVTDRCFNQLNYTTILAVLTGIEPVPSL